MTLAFRVPVKDIRPKKFDLLNETEQALALCMIVVAEETEDGILNNIDGLLEAFHGTQENLDVLEAVGYIKRIDDDTYQVILASKEEETDVSIRSR